MRKTTAELIADATAPLAGVDLDTAAPTAIDSVLADLNGLEFALYERLQGAYDRIHRAIGDKQRYYGHSAVWNLGRDEAVEEARARVAAPGYTPGFRDDTVAALQGLDTGTADWQLALAAIAPFEAQHTARQWTRFFWVAANGGHGHRSVNCSTCNNGRSRTRFDWHPELSGLTMADAVAKFGPTLCTRCFPDAPVEYTQGVKKDHCAGSRLREVPGTERRTGDRWYGECTACHTTQLKAGTVLRAHKPPAGK